MRRLARITPVTREQKKLKQATELKKIAAESERLAKQEVERTMSLKGRGRTETCKWSILTRRVVASVCLESEGKDFLSFFPR